MLKKVYQEGHGSTFESDGVLYDLNGIFKDAHNIPVNNIATAKLLWCIPKDLDPRRVEAADDTIPVLVTIYKGKPLTVDGAHRVTKRRMKQMVPKSKFPATTPYKLIPADVMKKHIIKKKG